MWSVGRTELGSRSMFASTPDVLVRMTEGKSTKHPDERVRIPLGPEEALRGLLKVDPESEPVEPEQKRPERESAKRPSRRSNPAN